MKTCSTSTMATALLKCYRPLIPFHLSSQRFIDKGFFIKAPIYGRIFHSRVRLRCFSSTIIGSHSESRPLTDDLKDAKESAKEQLWLSNTMSKKKELFKPKVPGKVGMYVCGVTAYDLSHIGHARVYVSFDVLYRYLKFMGYEVNYVRNFTDVDDKVSKVLDLGAKESVESVVPVSFSL